MFSLPRPNAVLSRVRAAWRSDAGSTTITFAISAVALAGAAGVAIDITRLQSTQQSLQQVADTVCRRVSHASLATYPTPDAVKTMAQSVATSALNQSGITRDSPNAQLSVSVTESSTATSENYNISISETSPSSFGQVVGYSGDRVSGSQQCSRPLTSQPPGNGGGGGQCNADNYIYVAAFTQSSPPASLSSTALAARSDQTVNNGYVSTILDSSGNILASQYFSGGYSYSAPMGANGTMTLYIQDVNADGSYPDNTCLQPQTVTTQSSNCDYTQFNHDTVAVKSASHTYWGGGFQISPAPSSVPPTLLPTDVVVTGVTKPGYQPMKVTLSKWFVPNNSTMVNFNNGGSSVDATAQDDYIYNIVVGKLQNVFDTNGNPLSAGASTDGASLASSPTPNKWRLVHVFNGTEGVWEDTTTGQCFNLRSPIALDLTGLGHIETTGSSTSPDVARVKLGRLVRFDAGEGDSQRIEWLVGNGQGFLVDNRDGRAASDMKSERLFGADGGFTDGYAKLAGFDHSGTGVLKGHDLDGLAVWIDDGDGVAEPKEIVPLAELGITELSVRADWIADSQGHRHLRSYAVRNGRKMMTEDVWLGVGVR